MPCICSRAVESEFKSNPIFPILSHFLSDLSDFYPIFRLFPTFRLTDSTALVWVATKPSMEYTKTKVHKNAISSDIKRLWLKSYVLEEMSSSTAKAISCSSTIPTLRLERQDAAPEQFHEEDPQSPLTPDHAHRSHLIAGRKRAAI